jgi:uncharacterized membrane protein
MFPLELPPQPPWEGLHPLVVHFPIALLFVTPVFVLLAGLLGKYGRWFGLTALMLLVMGTVSGYVAVSTGDAAFDVLEEIDDDGWEVVEEHQEAAKKVTSLFVGLTVLYAVILALPLVLWKLNAWLYWFVANLVFLALLMVVNIQLANAAHLGGRLVHQYGARAVLGEPAEEEEPGRSRRRDRGADGRGDRRSEPTDESPEEPMDEPAAEPADQPSDEPMDETETSDEAAEPAETPAEEASPVTPEIEKPETEPAPEEPAKPEAETEAGEKEPAEKAATEGEPRKHQPRKNRLMQTRRPTNPRLPD